MRTSYAAIFAASLLVSLAVITEDASAQKMRLEWPQVVVLTVSPSPLPVPALKLRLLPAVVEQSAGNAAMVYLTAFAAGDQVDFETVEKYLMMPLDQLPQEKAAAYVARFAGALRLLDVAARRSYCHWDDPIREEGLRMSVEYVRNGRLLGRVLALRIRLEIRERRYSEALRSLQTGFALARAFSTDALFLHAMASSDSDGIEKALYDRLREWTEARDSPNLYWALANLPRPFHDPRHLLEVEDAAVYFTFPNLRHPEELTASEAEQVMEQLWRLSDAQLDGPAARKAATDYVQRTLVQARDVLKRADRKPNKSDEPAATAVLHFMVDEYRREVDELYKWAGLPYWQSAAGLGRSVDRFRDGQANNPLLRLVPRINSQFLLMQTRDREAALLQCVEALRAYATNHNGQLPPSLESMALDTPVPHDPAQGKPFEYRLEDGTVVLKAASPLPGFPGSEREYRISLKP